MEVISLCVAYSSSCIQSHHWLLTLTQGSNKHLWRIISLILQRKASITVPSCCNLSLFLSSQFISSQQQPTLSSPRSIFRSELQGMKGQRNTLLQKAPRSDVNFIWDSWIFNRVKGDGGGRMRGKMNLEWGMGHWTSCLYTLLQQGQ